MSVEGSEESYEDDKVVETGPNGTYVCFDHKLGSGAFKTVYRALDTERGIEVAWNQVLIDRVQLDREKVLREIEFFKKIRHKHVIDFYNFWTDPSRNQVVFITELMPSGTLTDYIEKSPEVKLKIIKSWCKQILLGLNYLHTQNPPIIHRDIKCGNIFINGTTEGEVKIGDLGLATFSLKKDPLSVIGTPEFMAPEYYDENYTTSVDIWAFGMAMIEMVTLQCPYAECDNVGQIFKKVSGGIRPQQLNLIMDEKVREFISLCLADESERPTAAQLLEHPFFYPDQENDNEPVRIGTCQKVASQSRVPVIEPVKPIISPERSPEVEKKPKEITTSPKKAPVEKGSSVSQFDMTVVDREGDILEMKAQICIETDEHNENSELDFRYNLKQDSPKAMALDMIRSLELQSTSYDIIFNAFAKLEKKYSDNLDRTQTMTELSELISDEEENIDLSKSTSTIHSEMSNPVQPVESNNTSPVLSETEPIMSNSELSDLEALVEENELKDNMTLPTQPFQEHDMTDLEDLLDEEGSEGSFDSLLDDGFTNGSQATSDSYSSTDEQELLALKAKHEQDMLALLKHQEDELRSVTKRQHQKKMQRMKAAEISENQPEANTSADAAQAQLMEYYEEHKRDTQNLNNSVSPLYI